MSTRVGVQGWCSGEDPGGWLRWVGFASAAMVHPPRPMKLGSSLFLSPVVNVQLPPFALFAPRAVCILFARHFGRFGLPRPSPFALVCRPVSLSLPLQQTSQTTAANHSVLTLTMYSPDGSGVLCCTALHSHVHLHSHSHSLTHLPACCFAFCCHPLFFLVRFVCASGRLIASASP